MLMGFRLSAGFVYHYYRFNEMTVPTLPGTPWPPPLWFFMALDYGGEPLAYLLLLITLLLAYSYLFRYCCKCCCEVQCTWMVDLLTKGSRILNVFMFPGLFKKLKDRDEYKSRENNRLVTRVFTLFLDRRVENNFQIIISFYFFSLAIFSTGLLAFFHYIPVDIGSECLRRDNQDRTIFCYTNRSAWPVDCTAYNSTNSDMQKINFLCYSFSVFDLGIAIAAAAALAKLATVGITIYIKVSEFVYKKSIDKTSKWPHKCYRVHIVILSLVLLGLFVASEFGIDIIIAERVASGEGHHLKHTYIAYVLLPLVILPPLTIITCNLPKHCSQEEYTSYCEHQLPHSAEARDVLEDLNVTIQADIDNETIDIANPARDPEAAWGQSHNDGGACAALNETEETQLLQTNSSESGIRNRSTQV